MKLNENLLAILGLNGTEKTILEYLDTDKNIQSISRDTKISRTGTKYSLNRLVDRGLVEESRTGKRTNYRALSADALADKIQNAKDVFLLNNENLKGVRVKTSHENEFIIHVGVREILPAYQRIAATNKNCRIKAIQHHRSWSELIKKISPEQLVQFNKAIVDNKIILDGMLNESAYYSYQKEVLTDPKSNLDAIKSLEGRMADYTMFPDEVFNFDSEIWMFKSNILIINWKEEVAIEISNKNMAGFLNDMFEYVKMSGKKIDHNKYIADTLNKIDK